VLPSSKFPLAFGQVTSKIHLPEFIFACHLMFKHYNIIKFAIFIPFPPLLLVCMYYNIHTLVYIIVADLKKKGHIYFEIVENHAAIFNNRNFGPVVF
jgi:hypothetical protein